MIKPYFYNSTSCSVSATFARLVRFAKVFRYFSIAHSRLNDCLAMDSTIDPFNTIIPSEYTFGRNKPVYFHLELHQMNLDYFAVQVNTKVPYNCTYTVFIRVKYNYNEYFMAGNQFGFTFDNDKRIQQVFKVIVDRFNKYMEYYKLTAKDIRYVAVGF